MVVRDGGGKQVCLELLRNPEITVLLKALEWDRTATVDFILTHDIKINMRQVPKIKDGVMLPVKQITRIECQQLIDLEEIWGNYRQFTEWTSGCNDYIYTTDFVTQMIQNTITKVCEDEEQSSGMGKNGMYALWRCVLRVTYLYRRKQSIPEGVNQQPIYIPDILKKVYVDYARDTYTGYDEGDCKEYGYMSNCLGILNYQGGEDGAFSRILFNFLTEMIGVHKEGVKGKPIKQ